MHVREWILNILLMCFDHILQNIRLALTTSLRKLCQSYLSLSADSATQNLQSFYCIIYQLHIYKEPQRMHVSLTLVKHIKGIFLP